MRNGTGRSRPVSIVTSPRFRQDDRLRRRSDSDPKLKAKLPQLERAVAEGMLSPALAVDDIVATLGL